MTKYNIPSVKTFEFTKIIGIENINFGTNIIIDDFVLIYAKEKVILGDFVHIACFSSITGGAALIVGSFTAISQGCRVLTSTDDFKDWGFGNSTIDDRFRNHFTAPVSIGKFCIVGANSVVLPGVSIGEGVTIGANSVVTRDLAPWGVYIGNKRIAERNRDGVLKNFEKFHSVTEQERVGKLFK